MSTKKTHNTSLPEPQNIQFFRERWNYMIPGSFARYEGVDPSCKHAPLITITSAEGMKVLRFCGESADVAHDVQAVATLLKGCKEITFE